MDITIETFIGLKQGQLLDKLLKISRQTNFKKGQICFLGLEKAKPGNSDSDHHCQTCRALFFFFLAVRFRSFVALTENER